MAGTKKRNKEYRSNRVISDHPKSIATDILFALNLTSNFDQKHECGFHDGY